MEKKKKIQIFFFFGLFDWKTKTKEITEEH